MRSYASLPLSLLLGCSAGEASPDCVERPLEAPPSCETQPALCAAAVRADLRQRDPAVAVDLVFVPEGWSADELPAFRARVASLLRALDADRGGVIGRDPSRFNRYTLDLASPPGAAATDGALDTPLRGCLRADALTPEGTPLLAVHTALARFVARRAVPAADVVVVVVNADGGRANAPLQRGDEEDLGLALIRRDNPAHVLDHELGHALVHLGDEYVDGGDCWGEGSSPPGLARSPGPWWTSIAETPNLTDEPDGARWSSVLRGARAGGARHARCVYHPTDACRMGDDSRRPFCPVCDAAVERALADVRAGVDNRPPRCGLYVSARTADGEAVVCPFARAAGGPARVALRDGSGAVLLEAAVLPPPPVPSPSITLGRGCARVPLPPRGTRTVTLTCWSVTGARAEAALTLAP